jgi:hypothetical protein
MPGGGVWYIPQGGTGLTSVSPSKFLTVNSGGLFETTIPYPLPVNKGGFPDLTTLTPNSFVTTNGSNIVTTLATPGSDVMGISDTQYIGGKSFSTATNFSNVSPALSFGANYDITYVTPSATRTYTIQNPGSDTDFVFVNGAQTLLNKTITDNSNTVPASALTFPFGSVTINGGSTAPSISKVLTTTSGTNATWQYQKAILLFVQTTPVSFNYTLLNGTNGIAMEGSGAGTQTIPVDMPAAGLNFRVKYKGYFTPNGDTASYILTFTLNIAGVSTRVLGVQYSNTNQNNTFEMDFSGYFVTSTSVLTFMSYSGGMGATPFYTQSTTIGSPVTIVNSSGVAISTSAKISGGTGPNCLLVVNSIVFEVFQP